jgi:hypothetical protein
MVNHLFKAPAALLRTWPPISAPVLLAEVALHDQGSYSIDVSVRAAATASGRLNGVLIHYTCELSPTTTVSSDPFAPSADAQRSHTIWILDRQPQLRAGEAFTLVYRRHIPGIAARISAIGGQDPI